MTMHVSESSDLMSTMRGTTTLRACVGLLYPQRRRVGGQREAEARPTSRTGFGPRASSMRFDDAFDDEQAEAGAGAACVDRLPVAVEHVLPLGFGDSRR